MPPIEDATSQRQKSVERQSRNFFLGFWPFLTHLGGWGKKGGWRNIQWNPSIVKKGILFKKNVSLPWALFRRGEKGRTRRLVFISSAKSSFQFRPGASSFPHFLYMYSALILSGIKRHRVSLNVGIKKLFALCWRNKQHGIPISVASGSRVCPD